MKRVAYIWLVLLPLMIFGMLNAFLSLILSIIGFDSLGLSVGNVSRRIASFARKEVLK